MTVERFQVTLHTTDANPANYITNTWYGDVAGVPGRVNMANAIEDFYQNLITYFSVSIAQNGHDLVVYAMDDPEPRAPVLDTSFNLASAPTGTSLPAEVALCLSFQADRVSGISQARRRGRLYFGPWDTTALGTDQRPSPALVTTLSNAATAFLAQSVTDTDWLWVVYSTVLDDISYVSNGWIDNAFDTQRRRGLEYTARTLWS